MEKYGHVIRMNPSLRILGLYGINQVRFKRH